MDSILDAIGEASEEQSTVGIEAPSLAGLGISIVPSAYIGDYDRSVNGTFSFDVTFTGLAPGTYEFDRHGLVDGGRIAAEHNIITGTVGSFPEPGTLLPLGPALLGLVGLRLGDQIVQVAGKWEMDAGSILGSSRE